MFRTWIEQVSRDKKSNLILALDFHDETSTLLSRSIQTLKAVGEYICAVKVNHHLVLPLGLRNGVTHIINVSHDLGLPIIMDCKMSDIGSTNLVITENYYNAGFDAVTASPLVGWMDGLQTVFDMSRKLGKGVIILARMSHKGAEEIFNLKISDVEIGQIKPLYRLFVERSIEWNADGIVAGATVPTIIQELATMLRGKIPIYAPGVITQGGSTMDAVRSGARFIIVGRGVIYAPDPIAQARSLRDKCWQAFTEVD